MSTVIVVGRAHLSAHRILCGVDARQRSLLVVCVFLDFGIDPVIRLELLVVSVEPRTAYPLPLLGDLRLRLIGVDLAKVVVLL